MAGIAPRLPTERYRLIVDNSPVMIWRSSLDGRIDSARAGAGGTVKRASAPSAGYASGPSPGTKWLAQFGGPD
jgi:hypothetical protein